MWAVFHIISMLHFKVGMIENIVGSNTDKWHRYIRRPKINYRWNTLISFVHLKQQCERVEPHQYKQRIVSLSFYKSHELFSYTIVENSCKGSSYHQTCLSSLFLCCKLVLFDALELFLISKRLGQQYTIPHFLRTG